MTLDQVRVALRRLPIPERPVSERAASVALILKHGGAGLDLLLIRRSQRPGDPWAGHMALPGGHWERKDPDLLATAEREVREEVGLDLRLQAEFLGELPSVVARAQRPIPRLVIVPFVYHLTGEPILTTSPEVDEAFWAELGPPGHHEKDATFTVILDGFPRPMPAWMVGGYPVWGLTYAIIGSLLGAHARASDDRLAACRLPRTGEHEVMREIEHGEHADPGLP